MKKILTYYLLILYTASLCKPLTIWFSDALSHVYFSQGHKNVHQHDGESHVHDEIGKAAKDEAPLQKHSTSKTEEDTISPRSFDFKLITFCQANPDYNNAGTTTLPVIFTGTLSPPPRFC